MASLEIFIRQSFSSFCMKEKKEYLLWWKQACFDLESAKYNLDGRRYDVAAFLAHQCVEKALKAMHLYKSKPLLKIHDLTKLAHDIALPEKFYESCAKLSSVYISTRYPDYLQDVIPAELYTRKDVEGFISSAEEVLEWLQKKIEF